MAQSATLSLRPFAASLHANRRAVFLAFACVLAVALAGAALLRPNYKAQSTLLVLFGSEYTFRPDAGEMSMVNATLDREQVLRTEISLLQQPDLERETIARIGIATLYPQLLRPPGEIARRWHATIATSRALLHDWAPELIAAQSTQAGGMPPTEQARRLFDAHLDMRAMKAGNTIELSFTHPDAAVAARVLNVLAELYLQRRNALMATPESALVGAQADDLHRRLDEADSALAKFKRDNAIEGFDARRGILLQAQGALEAALHDDASALAESQARLLAAQTALAAAAPSVLQEQSADMDARLVPLRSSIDQLEVKLADLQTRYRPDSYALEDARHQLAIRQAELAHLRQDQSPSVLQMARNPLVTELESQRARAEADRSAAEAKRVANINSLRDVAASLAALSALEQRLNDLDRARKLLDQQYADARKLQEDRRITEQVQAGKVASVRVMQPALPPPVPEPTRRLVALAGFCFAVMAGLLAGVLGHALRRTYLLPELLRQDLGLSVLVSVPEAPRLARLQRLA